MVLAEWTKVESGGTGDLDAITKFEGLTSFKAMITASGATNAYVRLTRVAAANVRVILFRKLKTVFSSGSLTATMSIAHGYNAGGADTEIKAPIGIEVDTVDEPWAKYRITFWKDLDTGILWARIEYWITEFEETLGYWKFGEDIEIGIASYLTTIGLLLELVGDGVGTAEAWFDEVEVITE